MVAINATTIAPIIGRRKKEAIKAQVTPIRPAYHSEEKSVRTVGNIRAPKADTGKSNIHLRILLGSLFVKEIK